LARLQTVAVRVLLLLLVRAAAAAQMETESLQCYQSRQSLQHNKGVEQCIRQRNSKFATHQILQ
jgi:hypothetical protein